MVQGEHKREASLNAKYRDFSLGKDRPKERTKYDHVDVQNVLFGSSMIGTED